MTRTVALLGAICLAASLLGAGCANTKRSFKISSYPEGAVIFVDGEPRGQTNTERLVVDFAKTTSVMVRLEKDGYQSTGGILTSTSPEQAAYFLQESPSNERILKVLDNLQRLVDQFSNRLEMETMEDSRARTLREGDE